MARDSENERKGYQRCGDGQLGKHFGCDCGCDYDCDGEMIYADSKLEKRCGKRFVKRFGKRFEKRCENPNVYAENDFSSDFERKILYPDRRWSQIPSRRYQP